MTTDLACPVCGAELDVGVLFAHETDQRALARLAAVSIPLGARVMQYVALFTPPKTRLTAAKKIKLLLQLLPDLERRAITYKGRDWAVPLVAWALAFDQMLTSRDSGRLELPMKGHGYLYATLAGMASKHEAAAELEREQAARSRAHSSAAPTSVANALHPLPLGEGRGEGRPLTVQQALGAGIQPMLLAPQPAGTSPTVRAMRAAIERSKGEQP